MGVTLDNVTVDIILATFNGERFLPRLMESLCAQDFDNWRVIAHDDGSGDGTREVLAHWGETLGEKLFLVDDPPSGGSTANFLNTLRHSTADFALFCDQDDVWMPDKLSVFLRAAQERGWLDTAQPVLLFSDLCNVDAQLETTAPSFMRASHLDPARTELHHLLALNCVAGCASMGNRALVQMVDRTPDARDIVVHDIWCALVAACFGDIAYIDRPTVLYCQHEDNVVGAKTTGTQVAQGIQDGAGRKETLRGTVRQAQRLLEVYGADMPAETRVVVEVYATLDSLSKLGRLRACSAQGFWKYGFARKVDQLLNL